MAEIMPPFVFSEHILKMDYWPYIEEVNEKLSRRFLLSKTKNGLEKKLEELKGLQRTIKEEHNHVKSFFEGMLNNKHCTVELVKCIYDNLNIGAYYLKIDGKGTERFFIDGEVRYETSKDGKAKLLHIPTIIGNQSEVITIYDHPPPEATLPTLGSILVRYKFDTSLTLGYWGEDGMIFPFVSDPLDQGSDYFYGKPGKIVMRPLDRLTAELNQAIFYRKSASEDSKFNLEVSIIHEKGNKIFYKGNMDNTGSFPFFITKDTDGGTQEDMPAPALKLPSTVKN